VLKGVCARKLYVQVEFLPSLLPLVILVLVSKRYAKVCSMKNRESDGPSEADLEQADHVATILGHGRVGIVQLLVL